jgi:hypothetical protein
MSFIVAVEGAFFSDLSGAYWPSELELCGAELAVELCGLEAAVPGEAEGCPEPGEDAGELWVWAMPNGISVAASRPIKEKRIAERMIYTFSPETLRRQPDLDFNPARRKLLPGRTPLLSAPPGAKSTPDTPL